MTREEAMQNALDWAEGRKSHWNEFITAEATTESRPQTLAALAQADAAEVVKWTAIAAVLPDHEPAEATEALEAAIRAASPATNWTAIPHEQWRGLLAAIPHDPELRASGVGLEDTQEFVSPFVSMTELVADQPGFVRRCLDAADAEWHDHPATYEEALENLTVENWHTARTLIEARVALIEERATQARTDFASRAIVLVMSLSERLISDLSSEAVAARDDSHA
jgi:hypothetical protein